jgi:hypothetical protein
MVLWERSGGAYYATVIDHGDMARFHLFVERIEHRWQWIAWRPGDNSSVKSGVADNPSDAMRRAEGATT